MATVKKRPLYQLIKGIRCPATFSPRCFMEALQYKPASEDVIIVTYPKSGTTWMQSLVLHTYRKGKPLDTPSDFLIATPFIDMLGNDGVEKMLRPGALKTHLPYTHLPFSPETKYIFVFRNPLDVCVSLYHHTRSLPGYGYWDGELDDFFELFMAGEVEYNDYFDHLHSWYPHRNDKNTYYTTYENMKRDCKSVIHEVAHFIGKEYGELVEKDSGVLNNILQYCSFDYMKKNFSDLYNSFSKMGELLADEEAPEGLKYLAQQIATLNVPSTLPKAEFVRKGIVGDWKNHLSEEQAQRLRNKCHEKMTEFDLHNLWSL